MSNTLDKYDRAIIESLRKDARLSDTKLGEIIGRSTNAARLRRKRLQEEGYISQYTILISKEKSQYIKFYYILVSLNNNNRSNEIVIENYCKENIDILFCDGTMGDIDYILYFGETLACPADKVSMDLRNLNFVDSVTFLACTENVKTYQIRPERLIK